MFNSFRGPQPYTLTDGFVTDEAYTTGYYSFPAWIMIDLEMPHIVVEISLVGGRFTSLEALGFLQVNSFIQKYTKVQIFVKQKT